jgi:hypothetical protein
MNHRRITVVLLILLLVGLGVEATAADTAEGVAEPRGVVVSVVGDVQVNRSGTRHSALEGFVLMGGDTVVLQAGARCTGFTPQGESFTLDGPAELQFSSTVADGMIDNVATWVRRQLADWIGESRRRPLTTRGGRDWTVAGDAPVPVIPAPGGSVRSGRSTLYWSTVPGVDRYRLTVARDDGEEITRSVRDNSIALEELVAGAEYVWKVGPEVEGWNVQSEWRSFHVLAVDEEEEVDRVADSLDDLEAGVLLLSVGLHDEAIYRLDAAVESGSNDRSARLWRAQALAECGLYKEAYEDLARLREIE